MLALAWAGISFEVVPGVSSAIFSAWLGFRSGHAPRSMSAAFGVFTADDASAAASSSIDWSLAARMPTAVFLMGALRLERSSTTSSGTARLQTRLRLRSSAAAGRPANLLRHARRHPRARTIWQHRRRWSSEKSWRFGRSTRCEPAASAPSADDGRSLVARCRGVAYAGP